MSSGTVDERPRGARMRVVVATPDAVGERMAGPGIRAAHLARELGRVADVTLIASVDQRAHGLQALFPRESDPLPRLLSKGSRDAEAALQEADVLVGQPARGFVRRRKGQRFIADLFDPLVLELRELYGASPSIRQRIHLAAEWSRLTFALRTADLLMCAAPQQRRFYDQLRSTDAPWIEVPFGIDPEDIRFDRLRGNIAIWGGGVWEWLDPATAVRAVAALNRSGLDCRLLFLGRARPNPQVVDRRRETRFDELIAEGAPWVDANAEWVPYGDRLSWLGSAKAAIMLHRSTAEAEFAIRTRLFDAIAAGVPVVASAGGFAADLVSREGLGVVVPPGDVAAVAAALRRLFTDDGFQRVCVDNLERIRPRFAWRTVVRPLVAAVAEWGSRRH